MTIEHADNDSNRPGDPEYAEPDATVMLVDCLCGTVQNGLELDVANGDVVFTGSCGGCNRELQLRISARPLVKEA